MKRTEFNHIRSREVIIPFREVFLKLHLKYSVQWNTEGDKVQQGKFQLHAEKKVQHDQMVAQVSQRDCEISNLRDSSKFIWMWP